MTSQSERLSETEGRSGNSEQRRRLCKKEDHQNRDHKGQDPNEQENLFAALPISTAAATHTAETSKATPSIFHSHESSKNHIITAASSYFCS